MAVTYSIIEVRRGTVQAERLTVDCGTFNTPPAAGDVIWVAMSSYEGGGGCTHQAPIDNAGNAYTQVGTTITVQGTDYHVSLWKCLSATGNTPSPGDFLITGPTSPASYHIVIGWIVRPSAAVQLSGDLKTAVGVTDGNGTTPTSSPAPGSAAFFFCVGVRPQFDDLGLTEGSGWNALANGLDATWKGQAKYASATSMNTTLFTEYQITDGSAGLPAAWTDNEDTSKTRAVIITSLKAAGGGGGTFPGLFLGL